MEAKSETADTDTHNPQPLKSGFLYVHLTYFFFIFFLLIIDIGMYVPLTRAFEGHNIYYTNPTVALLFSLSKKK